METEAASVNTTYSNISSPNSVQSTSILATNNSNCQVSSPFSLPVISFEQQQLLTANSLQQVATSRQQLLISPKSQQKMMMAPFASINKQSSDDNRQQMQTVKTDNNIILQMPNEIRENVVVNDFIEIDRDQFEDAEDSKCKSLIELDSNSSEQNHPISFQPINNNTIGGRQKKLFTIDFEFG